MTVATEQKPPTLTPIKRRILSAAEEITSERSKRIDYLHTVQCQCVLPYRNPGDGVSQPVARSAAEVDPTVG